MNLRIWLCLAALLSLAGCATYKHVPDGYSGPVAQLLDSAYQLSGGKGELFYIESINGNAIQNAANATRRASYGRGFALTTMTESRSVKAEPMRLKLVGTNVTAAPVHEIASRAIGEFFTVSGEIEFTPQRGKAYRVIGKLTKESAEVWLEDFETNTPVTAKITAK